MLDKTYLGQPVVMKDEEVKVYFRITKLIGSIAKSISDTDSSELHSIVLITTPGGTTVESGIFFIDKATDLDIEKLIEFEQLQLKNYPDDPLYEGLLTEEQMKMI